jgi:enoyl-CoA hydratase/carnithine racemase
MVGTADIGVDSAMAPDSAELRVSRPGKGVIAVEIDRPARRNAMTRAMWRRMGDIVGEATDEGAAVLLITGGDKWFVAGSDLNEMQSRTWADSLTAQAQQTVRLLRQAPFITIAAVNGPALGGGAELALACDLIVAAEDSVFGHPEITHGFIPAAGATQLLIQRVGLTRAMDLVLTGRRLTGVEACDMGLVTRAVPAAQVLASALELAMTIAAYDPLATRLAAEVLRTAAAPNGYLTERLAQSVIFAARRPGPEVSGA